MDREESLRRLLHHAGNSIEATPPPLDDLLLRSVPDRSTPTKGRRVVAVAMTVACAGTALAVIGAVRSDTTAPSDHQVRIPLATSPTSVATESPSRTTEPHRSGDPSPLVLDLAECRDLKAYEVDAGATRPDEVSGTWYIPSGDDHDGGWAFVYAPGGGTVPSMLSGPDVRGAAQMADDDTGTYDWLSGGDVIARMSAKRMDLATVERLARSISEGTVDDIGYMALATPQRHAQILGTSCIRGDELLAVEVAIGDLASQVDYFGNSDPTSIEFEGGHAVATFGNAPDETLPTRPVSLLEWQELLHATEAAGPP